MVYLHSWWWQASLGGELDPGWARQFFCVSGVLSVSPKVCPAAHMKKAEGEDMAWEWSQRGTSQLHLGGGCLGTLRQVSPQLQASVQLLFPKTVQLQVFISPRVYEVEGTEIAVNTARDNTVQCSQPGEPLFREVKHCPLLLWDKFCRSWSAQGLSRTVLLRVPADKERWTIIYPSYLVMMAQHDTSAFGRNNNNQLKQFAAAYRQPFHSCASQITFVTFLIFLALEAARGSNQFCFILLLHTRKIKELKPTHVYKALTHPSTLLDTFPLAILILKCEIFTCLVPLVPYALFKRWRGVVRAFTIFLARPVL